MTCQVLLDIRTVLWITTTTICAIIWSLLSFDDTRFYLAFCRLNQYYWRLFGLRVFLFGDELILRNKTLLICNHRSMYDILAIFYVSGHFNQVIQFCLKHSLTYVPGIGWWCRRMGFPILRRNSDDIARLRVHAVQCPILIFPEGSRYTSRKYAACMEYAQQHNLSISKYALLPKYKGSFALSSSCGAVYQLTIVYLDSHGRVMCGENNVRPSSMYINIKAQTDVPNDESDYRQWLYAQFADIDSVLDDIQIRKDRIEMIPSYQYLDFGIYASIAIIIVSCVWFGVVRLCT